MSISESVKMAVEKCFSGRFLALTSIVVTYCITMVITLSLVNKRVIAWDMFIAIFIPFAMTAKDVVLFYFERDDRPKTEIKPEIKKEAKDV